MSSSRKVLLTIVSSILIVSALTFTFVWFLVGDAYTQEAPPAERDVPPGAHLYVLSPTDGKVIFYKALPEESPIKVIRNSEGVITGYSSCRGWSFVSGCKTGTIPVIEWNDFREYATYAEANSNLNPPSENLLLASSGIILIVQDPLELDSENRVVARPPQKK